MIKPLGDRIVIKVVEETEQTSGGIFIPDSAKEKPQRGEVVAVGLGKMNEKVKENQWTLKLVILFFMQNIQEQMLKLMVLNTKFFLSKML